MIGQYNDIFKLSRCEFFFSSLLDFSKYKSRASQVYMRTFNDSSISGFLSHIATAATLYIYEVKHLKFSEFYLNLEINNRLCAFLNESGINYLRHRRIVNFQSKPKN